ncbi:MAG: glycoside hydrolase family 2, partial [Chloroflexi bacterium]|nr:glycoside hydrolase family 2 [Chloroflexota bacterium]
MDYRKGQPSVDLTGAWSFAFRDGDVPAQYPTVAALARAGCRAYPCTVPGNLELDLQAVGLLPELFEGMNMLAARDLEHRHVWYWREFDATPDPTRHSELVFEGLDCYADVYLNGILLGSTDNMLIEQVLDVDGVLRAHNELLVHICPAYDAAKQYPYSASDWALAFNYESLYVRKAPHMYGWDIMPRALSAGIWRPVTLRSRPLERLEEVYLQTLEAAPGRATAQLGLYFKARTAGDSRAVYELALTGVCGTARFEQRRRLMFDVGQLSVEVADPQLWWPAGRGPQNLYDVTVQLLKDGVELDRMSLRHGIRTVALERTSITGPNGEGEFCFVCNGERLFVKGSNWVPVDAFHSRDRQRIPQIVALAEELGINMFRCWGGNVYEDDLFFDLCDEKGILVWQDFAMACAVYPQDDAFGRRLAAEARAVAKRLRQHASLALWAGDNECDQFWSRHRVKVDPNTNILTRRVLPDVLRIEDPQRPYLPSSPYIDSAAFKAGERYLPEFHLWGPRDYYKSDYYRQSLCHFVSEIG